MTDFITALDQLRVWCSQILVMQFASWVTMIPIAIFSVNEIVKIFKRIR